MIFRVIRDHLTPEFAVADCCRVLGVSTSGYYRWRGHPDGKRAARRAELAEQIRVVHEASRRTYGAPKIRAELLKRGVKLNRKTVARIMRASSIRSKVARRFKVRTTDSHHAHPVAPNVLDRRFTAQKPDAAWLCDITYIPTGEGLLYLAGVMDLCSRRIVGWSMADHLRVGLVTAALQMATRTRSPSPGLIVHERFAAQLRTGRSPDGDDGGVHPSASCPAVSPEIISLRVPSVAPAKTHAAIRGRIAAKCLFSGL